MISMSSCTRVYHRSSIWITNRVRMGSENKWIRLAAMYSILLLYSLYDTEHIDWWLPSLFTWTKTLAIHSYISTSLFHIWICAMDTNTWLPSYVVTTCTHQIDPANVW
eukprot:45638_1